MKKILLCLIVTLFIQNVYSQDDNALINYLQNHYNFKIGDTIPDKILKETMLTIEHIQINDLNILKLFPELNFLRLYKCTVNSIKNLPEKISSLMIDWKKRTN
jgi:hypothetical protein